MIPPQAAPSLVLGVLLAVTGCGKSLEVIGQKEKVVGQTVTLALTEGDPTFSGDLWLQASDETIYESRDLKVTQKDDRTLSFVVPPDVSVGPAHALAWADSGVYKVPLNLNRLALTIDNKGILEGWPLPPGAMTKPTRSFTAGTALAVVTPGGGELVVATGGQLFFVGLGNELKDAIAGTKLAGVTALAAVPGGVLAATENMLSLVRFGSSTPIQVPIPGLRGVAASETGDRAFVLSACDTNSDSTPDSDCVTEVAIGAELTAGKPVVLDAVPSATVIGATRDGRGVVVGDTDFVYGVWFDPLPKVTKVGWASKGAAFAAQPVAVDHAATVVKSGNEVKDVDLFAVAEKAKNTIAFLAFNPVALNDLQKTSEATLPEAPVAISYGRRTELFAAGGRNLYLLDAGQISPTVKKLGAQTAGAIQTLAVQP